MMKRPDVNLYSIANNPSVGAVVLGNLWADPTVHADAFKLTNSAHAIIQLGHVKGGYEDCADINNHCQNCTIQADLWEPHGNFLATIKGGSRDITLRGNVRGHGRIVDIDLGNISDQSDDLTGPITLALKHELGEPITVRVLGARAPRMLNSYEQRYEVIFEIPNPFKSFFLKLYKQLKKVLPI
jgi:hypothetical protein